MEDNKKTKDFRLSYESDGKMGKHQEEFQKENNKDNNKDNKKAAAFFNTTQSSE
jgi:hypothetical protein